MITVARSRNRFVVLALLLVVGLASPVVQAAGAVTESSISSGGTERSYRLYQPSSYRAGKPMPLVVAMHGGLGTGEIFASQTGFDAVAEKNGFLVVYPDGYKRAWNAGRCCGPPKDQKIDDVGYIRALVVQLVRTHSVDSARIFATGFSNGAMLAHRIACEAPELFVAIAPVSGGLMTESCPSKQPISALLVQGYLDDRIPWNGGTFDGTYRPSIKELVTAIGARGGCSGAETVTRTGDGFECRTLGGCRGGTEVSWCKLEAVGHQWGGGKSYLRVVLGPNSDTFPTSQRIWDFFSHHRRQSGAGRP